MTVGAPSSRARALAAKRRAAASSVALVAAGYECSLCPCIARFSRRERTIRGGDDL